MEKTEEQIIREVFDEDYRYSESPASSNVKVWIDGYGVMFTLRGATMNTVVSNMTTLIEYAKKKGWKTSWMEDKEQEVTRQDDTESQKEEIQEDCKHINITTKRASGFNKPENKGKLYEACLDCNRFLNWK